MSPQRVQTLRSSTKGQRPGAGTREPGEFYVNFADLQLGVVNVAKSAQDLIAVRFFSTASDYAIGNFVVQAGVLYRAKVAITAGAFNASNWDTIATSVDLSGKENTIAAGTTADYWRGDKTWVPLTKASVGLGNVDNTSDASKPVSTATQTALNLKVDKAGDTMTGHLVLPISPGNTNAVRKDYVDSADTTLQNNINLKANIASPAFTGNPTSVTPTAGDNDTSIATTAFVTSAVTTGTSGKIGEAPIDGIQYVRQNAAWSPVAVPPGTAVSDAPPGSPAAGQLWFESDSGRLFIYYTDANSSQWVQLNGPSLGGGTAETRNRLVNPAMQVSQQNGDTADPTPGYYPADQWMHSYVSSGGTAAFWCARNHAVAPSGTRNRLSTQAVTPDTSIAATENWHFVQAIEGIRVADFGWGTASAKQVVLRFGVNCYMAGTFGGSIRNGATNRSFTFSYTISAGEVGLDVYRTVVIPGDTTGTWPIDTSAGMYVDFAFMAGTSFQTAPNVWTAGNFTAPTGITNGAAVAAQFQIFDVGLYLDPNNTGVPPAWVMPDEAQELAACQRYFNVYPGILVNTGAISPSTVFPVEMRVAPAWTGGGAGFAATLNSNRLAQLNQTSAAYLNINASARM